MTKIEGIEEAEEIKRKKMKDLDSIFRLNPFNPDEPEKIEITWEIINALATGACGFSRHILSILDVPYPPKHGWRQRLVGKTRPAKPILALLRDAEAGDLGKYKASSLKRARMAAPKTKPKKIPDVGGVGWQEYMESLPKSERKAARRRRRKEMKTANRKKYYARDTNRTIAKLKRLAEAAPAVVVVRPAAASSEASAELGSSLRHLPYEKYDAIIRAFYRTPEWKRVRYDCLQRHGARCLACGATPATGDVINVDHIKPLIDRWDLRLDPENVQPLCADCNEGKGNRRTNDWR